GIRQAGFWTVLVGDGRNQDLHYLLAWEPLAEREAKWNKFVNDPEGVSKRAESEQDGPTIASIKNMFLQPTAFSAVKGRQLRCPAGSTTWSMLCATSTRPPNFIGGSASPSARATGMHGVPTIIWSSFPASSSNCSLWQSRKSSEATASRRCSARSTGSFSKTGRDFPC